MSSNKLKLNTLFDLHDNRILKEDANGDSQVTYFIDSYQRGYRWDKSQITFLLEDLWEFHEHSQNKILKPNEYYCLQPIVLKPKLDNGKHIWEVLDGQQRLTSLKIVIQYLLNQINSTLEDEYSISGFDIKYKTRPTSQKFLSEIGEKYAKSERLENIDFYYMSNAYQTIDEWFTGKNISQKREKRDFLDQLMTNKDVSNPVKVIWYEVNDETDSYEIFTRLNIGKIKLTNSELIKALFLKRTNKNQSEVNRQLIEISNDWNIVEQKLQNDEFWYFIYQTKTGENYKNRIEFIFDLYCDKTDMSEEYHSFYRMFKNMSNEDVDDFDNRTAEWIRFKKYFQILEGWFIDYEFYHYVGYLIAIGYSVKMIIKDSEGQNKQAFLTAIQETVRKQLDLTEDQLRDLKYNNNAVYKALLLFNILTVISNRKSNYRFPFNLLKSQNWDIEHIRSRNDKVLNTDAEWQIWTKDILEYFTGKDIEQMQDDFTQSLEPFYSDIELSEFGDDLSMKIKELLGHYFAKAFQKSTLQFYFEFFKNHFNEHLENVDKDSIYNLALLDSYTNRSYGNAFYSIKRKRIQENGKYGIFTPICTTNVFMKVYSKKLENLSYWTSADAENYLTEIIKVTKGFLKPL